MTGTTGRQAITLGRLLAIGLLLALIWLIIGWLQPLAPVNVSGLSSKSEGAATAPGPAAIISNGTEAGVALARPLFSPTRQPANAPITTVERRLPRLVGLFGDGRATFEMPGGRTVIARAGDTVGPWRVALITADGVKLEQEGEEQFLTLLP